MVLQCLLSLVNALSIMHIVPGADPGGGAIGAIAPLKLTKATLFTIILYISENSVSDIRPFCRPLLCHSSVVKYTSSLL